MEASNLYKSNSGLIIEERDGSTTSVTALYNQLSLVVGSSRKGKFNAPVLIVSPEQFINLYGDIDPALERKGSYFHRTVLNMIENGPVICMNLRVIDDVDKYNWVSLSTTSKVANGKTKTNKLTDFYDTTTGFWAKSVEQVFTLARNKYATQLPLHFVNTSTTPMSLLVYKSTSKGFDIPVEDWYDSDTPPYLHPRELISDYMVDVIAVEGKWDDYKELATNPQWSAYFDRSGIRKDMVKSFLLQPGVNLIRKWTSSLIPYFKDKSGKYIGLQDSINTDANETGLLCAYNIEEVETEARMGNIDLLGDSLRASRGNVDYLSYKRNLTDVVLLEEKYLDQPGNVFGNHEGAYTQTKTADMGEGFLYNVRLKPSLLSMSFSGDTLTVSPLIYTTDSYYILNGKKRRFAQTITDTLAIHEVLQPGFQISYTVYVDNHGVQFKASSRSDLNRDVLYSYILPTNTIVLGYYVIKKALNGVITDELFPVAVNTSGFVSPFRKNITTLHVTALQMPVNIIMSYLTNNTFQTKTLLIEIIETTNVVNALSEEDTTTIIQHLAGFNIIGQVKRIITQRALTGSTVNIIDNTHPSVYFAEPRAATEPILYFENANIVSGYTYHNSRLYHLWQWLSSTLVEKQSMLVNNAGVKNRIEWIEQENDANGRYFAFGMQEKAAIAASPSDFLVYVEDNETLTGLVPHGTDIGSTIGEQSALYKSYLDGNIDSGDVVFYSLGEESDVHFAVINQENTITFKKPSFQVYENKIILQGTEKNDDVFTILRTDVVGQWMRLIVEELVVVESVLASVNIFDATEVSRMKLAVVNGKLHAEIDDAAVTAEQVYDKVYDERQSGEWKRTIDILSIINDTTITIDFERYHNALDEGDYLSAILTTYSDSASEVARSWTRIVDIYRDVDPARLVLVCDASIAVTIGLSGGLQTESFEPLHKYIKSLDFKYLDSYKVRERGLPDGSDDRQNEILSMLSGRLATALSTDRMEWRYLVDSYGLGLSGSCKEPLARLCAMKNGLGFLNLPSIKSFRTSKSTQFTTSRLFDTKLLLKGGDRKQFAGPVFTLTQQGKSNVAYFTPFVKVDDGTRIASVPPASFVATSYMNKFNYDNRLPWEVVANARGGRVRGIIGLEEDFDDNQLVDLNAFRVNAITSYQNSYFYITEENTAEQGNSSLGYAHCREVLISLEAELRQVLAFYHWSPFTIVAVYQQQIERAANEVCTQYKQKNALYAFNNHFVADNEMIDNQVGILQTEVELVKSFKTVILRVNISNTKK